MSVKHLNIPHEPQAQRPTYRQRLVIARDNAMKAVEKIDKQLKMIDENPIIEQFLEVMEGQ